MWPAATTRLAGAVGGEVVDRGDDAVTLRGDDYELTLTGVDVGAVAGRAVARRGPARGSRGGPVAELSVRPVGAPPAPRLTRPNWRRAGWR